MKRVLTMDRKNKWYAAAGSVMLMMAMILQIAARNINGFATWYAHHVYPVLVGAVGRFFGIFPFSVVEVCLYLLVFLSIVYAVRFFREPWRLVSRTIFLVGILLFSYTANCGVNYYAVPFSSYAGLETSLYTKAELEELCRFLMEKVNENVTEERYSDHRQAWRKEGIKAMGEAAKQYECLGGFYPMPKEVAWSYILSVQQLCGIYVPFTIESNFNGDMPSYNVPHTICHELSHLKGFMREDEANFIGYLACVSSENQAFRYSGYLMGWIYAGNALAKADMKAYMELREQLDPQAELDLQENNAFWDRYEGKVAEAANQINDTYLKMNDQTDGVQSYGRAVDLMLAYYKR